MKPSREERYSYRLLICASIKVQRLTFSKRKANITSARKTSLRFIKVHRKSKESTVLQQEKNIGQLLTFNAVLVRCLRKEILNNNLVNNP